MISPQRFLQIDAEGYFISDGLRITDEEYGQSLLKELRLGESGALTVEVEGHSVIVEAFDDPVVIRTVQKTADQLVAHAPYYWEFPLHLKSLSVDEWDRFHGRTEAGLAFVLSRAAQAQLFELVDEYDDDSLTLNGERYVLGPWLVPATVGNQPEFWSRIYKEETPPWELGRETPVLPAILPQLKQPRSRIIVLGCGNGHDAAYLARAGHIVTGVDFSPQALAQAQKSYGDVKDLRFIEADVFRLPPEMRAQFDIVFDHTCYCAISPDRRNELVAVWSKLLAENGHLLAVFFARDRQTGPPWGGSEWETRERLKKSFEFQYWTRWRHSIPRRQGTEFVVYARKKPTLGSKA